LFEHALGFLKISAAEDDKVVKRYTWRGTHQGEWNGIPATGKQITMSGITIYRIGEGKIRECWWAYDVLVVLQQFGVVPAPEQAAA
jgi:predicted ester cyclase